MEYFSVAELDRTTQQSLLRTNWRLAVDGLIPAFMLTAEERDRLTPPDNKLMHKQEILVREREQKNKNNKNTDAVEDEYIDMLSYLMAQDPVYAEFYEITYLQLESVNNATYQALKDLDQRIAQSKENIERMEREAVRLDDGTLVFKSEKSGKVYTQDGSMLSDEQAGAILFNGSEPSWETYQQERTNLAFTQNQKLEVERYKADVIDPIQERMNNRDQPPSMEELQEFQELLSVDKMPDVVRQYYRSPESGLSADTTNIPQPRDIHQNLNDDNIRSKFSYAHNAISPSQPVVENTLDTTIPELDELEEMATPNLLVNNFGSPK